MKFNQILDSFANVELASLKHLFSKYDFKYDCILPMPMHLHLTWKKKPCTWNPNVISTRKTTTSLILVTHFSQWKLGFWIKMNLHYAYVYRDVLQSNITNCSVGDLEKMTPKSPLVLKFAHFLSLIFVRVLMVSLILNQ